VLQNDTDPSGFPLKAVIASAGDCSSVQLNPDGSFTATAAGASCSFTYTAVNSQNTASGAATATVSFGAASNW